MNTQEKKDKREAVKHLDKRRGRGGTLGVSP